MNMNLQNILSPSLSAYLSALFSKSGSYATDFDSAESFPYLNVGHTLIDLEGISPEFTEIMEEDDLLIIQGTQIKEGISFPFRKIYRFRNKNHLIKNIQFQHGFLDVHAA